MTEIQNRSLTKVWKFDHWHSGFACPVKYVSIHFLVWIITMVSKSEIIDFKQNYLTG